MCLTISNVYICLTIFSAYNYGADDHYLNGRHIVQNTVTYPAYCPSISNFTVLSLAYIVHVLTCAVAIQLPTEDLDRQTQMHRPVGSSQPADNPESQDNNYDVGHCLATKVYTGKLLTTGWEWMG